MKHGFVYAAGVRLHYVTDGRGPLLVLLHGFPEFWYSWRSQIPVLARYFKVVAVDMRGYNESDKPAGVRAYSVEKLVNDVKCVVRAFGEEQAVIVGHDWGGVVAWSFGATYPEMTRRLVVMNAPHPVAFEKALRTDRRQLRRSWYIFWFQLPKLPEWGIRVFAGRFVKNAFQGTAVMKEVFTAEELQVYETALTLPGVAKAAVNYYRAAFRRFLLGKVSAMPTIRIPTLLIWGEQAAALGKELTDGKQKYFSDRFEIKYVPDSGHWVQQEQRSIVNDCLIEFLID